MTLGAAALLAAVPFVARPFLRESVHALEDVSAGVFVGSLISVCVLVAAPVLALGMVSPYAIRLSVAGAEGAGRISGRLYAISTLGSLGGTFAAALALIPLIGTRRTFSPSRSPSRSPPASGCRAGRCSPRSRSPR